MPSLFRQPCQCHRPMIAPKWGNTCGQCAGTLPGCTPAHVASDRLSTVIPPVGRIDNVSRETIAAYYRAEQDAPSLSVPSWVQRALSGTLPVKDLTRG